MWTRGRTGLGGARWSLAERTDYICRRKTHKSLLEIFQDEPAVGCTRLKNQLSMSLQVCVSTYHRNC
ncbi:hypothetical protein QQF64_019321 [Cirrhinus molitorella]|uniref:Uncharacterized protein n=1 Tax=Cirrhinus molitorella TaxID=172907 RepID=A0ABR3LF89_9TELE